MKIVLDTSVIINGLVLKELNQDEFEETEIIIPKPALDELQAQASKGLEIGFKGLKELASIRQLCSKKGLKYSVIGPMPSMEDIKLAHSGRIDSMIKDVARSHDATLYTSDFVLHLVCEAEGIASKYMLPPTEQKPMMVESFFADDVLSVHLKEGVPPYVKKGSPGNFTLVKLNEKPLDSDRMEAIINEINDRSRGKNGTFIEMKMGGATVIQLENYRIVIARPPFSDGKEVTIVRPIVKLTLDDYHIQPEIIERLEKKAEGVIIAGPPGSGKSTLASSIAEFYTRKGKVVKTFESPRDLQVGPEITQYGPLEGDFEKTAEILLLVRPDYTVFDEVRKTKDFMVFADMRLAGVGMIGVVHSSEPIDAVQRFFGRIDLGMIPHIVDTIIFVKNGAIKKVLTLNLAVRVPNGMSEEDLSRPIVEVREFDTTKLEYEIYTYGEEKVVVPISERTEANQRRQLRRRSVDALQAIIAEYDPDAEILHSRGNRIILKVDRDVIPRIIGKGGENITKMEKASGVRITIEPRD